METSNMQQPGMPDQEQVLSKKQRRRLEKQEAKLARHAGQTVKSSGKRIAFWLVILAIIGFFVYAIGQLATSSPSSEGTKTDIAITSEDHTLGNPNASVQIVEYADFQCPGCGSFAPIVKQITEEYKDKIYYAYRHFPLPQHQHAKAMAQAAEAAGKQGKFFDMADLIFKNQAAWFSLISVDKTISAYAAQLKLDTTRFAADINSKEAKDFITTQRDGGVTYGVNSTPTFFLNGTKMNLPRSIEEFRTIIDNALLSATNASTTAPKN